MTINFVKNPNATATGDANATGINNLPLKTRILTSVGLTMTDIPNAETISVEELRLHAAKLFLDAYGYDPLEVSVLINKGREEAATVLLKGHFESLVRRAKAGFKVFPVELMEAYREGDLVCVAPKGKLPNKAFLKAFDGIIRIKDDEVLNMVNSGKAILVANEETLNGLLMDIKDDKDRRQIREQAYTMERITRDIVMANPMTPEKLVEFLADAKLDGNIVRATWGYKTVNFDFDAMSIDGKVILPNVMCYGMPLNQAQVIAAFALSLDGVLKQSSAEAKVVAAAPSVFVETYHNYDDRKDGDRHTPVVENKVGTLSFNFKKVNNATFSVSDARSAEEVVAAGRYFLRQGVPVCFEQQAGWVTIGDGARASLVGIKVNNEGEFFVVFGTDANKATKLLSRPKLATGTIAKTINPLTGESTTEASGLLIPMGDGRLVKAYGTRVDRVAISNFTLAPNSGQAIVKEGFTRTVCVEKTIRAQIDGIWTGQVEKDLDVSKQVHALQEAIKRGLEINRDVLKHGDAIITFDNVVRAFWDNHGMEAKVIGQPKVKIRSTEDSATVTIKVAASYTDFAHKFRADGFKTTGTAGTLTCTDVATGKQIDQYTITFSTEDIKGVHVALLRAWADSIITDLDGALAKGWITASDHAVGGVVYNPDTGLTDEQREAMKAWRDANAKVVDITVEDMDDFHVSLIRKMVAKAKSDPKWAAENDIDPDAYSFKDGKVTQRCLVVEASVVLGIEVSTVRENIVNQPGIGEQTIALKCILKDLGDGLWKSASSQRRSVYEMMEVALNRTANEVFEIAGMPVLQHDLALRGRDLLKHYKTMFPKGVTFKKDGNVSVTLHFGALMQLGALLPGGAATGVAQTVLELLNHLHVSKEGGNGWDNHLNRLISKVKKAALKWAASKGILGRVTRTGKVFAGRKVKTHYSKALGYNEIGLNPLDPAVLSGKVEAGDVVMVGRSPMISMVGGRVVITELCPLGCVLVKSHLWSWGNEGDGDGDPASFLVVPEALAARALTALARSAFGPRGYLMAHGQDVLAHPYTEFFMGNAKADKNPHGDEAIHTTASFSVEEYADTAENVGRHYSLFLGRTFAITSYLTYLLGKKLETLGESGMDAAHETAVVYAWRLLYEGIGLSGYSPKAGSLAVAFRTLTNQNRVYIPAKVAEKLADKDVDVLTETSDEGEVRFFLEGISALKWAWEDTIGKEIDHDVAEYVYNAVLATGCYSRLERELDQYRGPHEILAEVGEGHLVGFVDAALIYGSLRRGSKGLAVAMALNESEHDGMFEHLTPEHLAMVGNGIVGQMLHAVVKVQKDAKVVRELLAE